jgi:hypothetical protein
MMKIAAVSDDGVSISQHFGRAPQYVVLTIEEGQIVANELRPKVGHHTFASQEHSHLAPGERHGCDAGSEPKHRLMAEPSLTAGWHRQRHGLGPYEQGGRHSPRYHRPH